MKKIAVLLFGVAALSAAMTSHASSYGLKTQTSNNIGLSVSNYQYQEPGVMWSSGSKFGVDASFIRVSQDEQFLRGELRYAVGKVDYSGSGTASGEPDWYIEARGLFGKDWAYNKAVLSPYLGIGYRYLFNDARGITSTGHPGYRRESNYLYLPFGIIHRQHLKDRARLVSTLELDLLMSGTQVSKLSDTGLGYSDVTNKQHSGYGLKWSLIYEKNDWAIGPYSHYWNIAKSDVTVLYQNGSPVGIAWEPQNYTVEFGLRIGKQF